MQLQKEAYYHEPNSDSHPRVIGVRFIRGKFCIGVGSIRVWSRGIIVDCPNYTATSKTGPIVVTHLPGTAKPFLGGLNGVAN